LFDFYYTGRFKTTNTINQVVLTSTGLPHSQEKSGKTKKNDKSQVKWGFLKKSENFFFKHQALSVQIYQFPYI